MSGGLIVVNGQRFCAADIRNWRVEEHTMTLAREESVDLIWGLRFRTRIWTEPTLVRTVVVDYRGEKHVYHDSPKLLANIGLFLEKKDIELTPELREVWQGSQEAVNWHYLRDLDGLVLELESKTQI